MQVVFQFARSWKRMESSRGTDTRRGRSSIAAFLLSWLAPGLGQLYNGQGRKALFVLLLEIAVGLLIIPTGGYWVEYGAAGLHLFTAAPCLLNIFASLDAAKTASAGGGLPVRWYNRPLGYIIYVLIVGLGLLAFIPLLKQTLPLWPARVYWIPSRSMMPTLQVGDRIVVQQLLGDRTLLRPMDIVIYTLPEAETSLVARLVALPGDTIEVRAGKVQVNGKILTLPGLEEPFGDFGPHTVPPGHGFVLGDNINNARDSRFSSPLPLENITARARFIYSGPGAGTKFP